MTQSKEFLVNGFVALVFLILAFLLKAPLALVFLLGFIFFIGTFFHPLGALGLVIFSYGFLPDFLSLGLVMTYGIVIILLGYFREDCKLYFSSKESLVYLWLLLLFIATLTSSMVQGSLRDLAIHFGGFLLFLTMLSLVETKKDLYTLVFALMMGTFLMSLYGVSQIFTGAEMSKDWVDVENNPNIRVRIYSVFGNPNIFAEYLVMTLPLALGLVVSGKSDKRKIFYGLVFLTGCVALFFTLSRGGLIGFFAGLACFIFLLKKRLFLLGIPLVGGLISLAPQGFINRLQSILNFSDTSTSYRFNIWRTTLDIIKDHPYGLGLGHRPFKAVYENYNPIYPTFHAHNTYLELTAELSLFGTIFFLIFILGIFILGYRYLIKSKDKQIRILGAAALAGLFGVFVHGMFENILYLTKITLTVWLLIAIIYSLIKIERKEEAYD